MKRINTQSIQSQAGKGLVIEKDQLIRHLTGSTEETALKVWLWINYGGKTRPNWLEVTSSHMKKDILKDAKGSVSGFFNQNRNLFLGPHPLILKGTFQQKE